MANQMTDMEEGSKGGNRSVLIVGIVAAFLLAFVLFFGYRGGSQSVAPDTAQPTAPHRGAGQTGSPGAVITHRGPKGLEVEKMAGGEAPGGAPALHS